VSPLEVFHKASPRWADLDAVRGARFFEPRKLQPFKSPGGEPHLAIHVAMPSCISALASANFPLLSQRTGALQRTQTHQSTPYPHREGPEFRSRRSPAGSISAADV
jgi:hypothetical protein